jgi:hypothetical protein
MKERVIILFLLVMLSNSVLALKIGVSPPEINYFGEAGENICSNITLFSDRKIIVIAEDRWGDAKSRNILDYKKSADEFGVSLEYEKISEVDKEEKLSMCLKSENSGVYYGAFLFHAENSPAGIGVWIVLNISGNNKEVVKNDIIRITGAVIGSNSRNYPAILLTVFAIILLIILILLIRVSGR